MVGARTIEAIVAGGVDVGEAHRVVYLLGPEGRLSALAPNARASKRRFGAALQPFTSIRAELGRAGSGGLVTLARAEVLRARLGLSASLEKLALASYATELAHRLAPENLPTEIPVRLEALLEALLDAPPTPAHRRAFELGLLDELGYRPETDACPRCGGPGRYLDLVEGGVFCAAHRGAGREIGPKTTAWLRAVLRAGPVPDGPLEPDEAARAARAVGPSVDAALRALLDRALASSALVAELGL